MSHENNARIEELAKEQKIPTENIQEVLSTGNLNDIFEIEHTLSISTYVHLCLYNMVLDLDYVKSYVIFQLFPTITITEHFFCSYDSISVIPHPSHECFFSDNCSMKYYSR